MSDLYRPDWPLVRISDFAEINIGGTPSRAAPQFWATKPEGSPWIAISDLKGKYVDDTKEYITDLGAKCSNVKLIEPFTTVMSFKLTVGRTAITTRSMYCNEAIAIFSPKSDALSGGWLYHALPRAAQSVVTDNAVKGATLNKAKMAEMTVQLPPITEQRKIAQILDTLDTAIRETEVLIDKLKAVKQGLLHDLLTRGIDANGQLRPPQSEAPQLYKESPLGWIPREWEEVTLGKIALRASGLLQTGPFGSQLHAHEYVSDGIPVIMPQDMVDGELSVESIARITPRKAVRLSRHRVRLNDLVFSRRGDLSRCVAIEDEHAGWLCGTGCLLARLPADEINGYWLSLVYQQPAVQSQVMGRAVGSTMANLNTSILAAITIARPGITEQDEIAKRLKAVGQRLTGEERQLAKMRLEKVGLMDDLLTGRIRVTPLLDGAATS